MNWPYRHIVIVAAVDQAAANVVAASIDPDDGSKTFSVGLSADGSEPATHFGCHTLSDDTMAGAMFDAQPVLASVKWWRLTPAGLLIDSNTPHGTPGDAWRFADAIASQGLQVIEPEEVA